ncbi:MAG: hypothetical protein SVW51_08995 [Pseudomonadota bacterium]|nr:hypothetical protein [Pseudomonadota bacterium]
MLFTLKTAQKNNLVRSFCLLASIVLIPVNAFASTDLSSLQLKTSIQEVNGVREIEAGDYQTGIRKTEAYLNKLKVMSVRAPYLNNLCVAYIAQENFDKAPGVCDESVKANRESAIALNNRAVLHYLQGNMLASRADMTKAVETASQNRVVNHNQQIIGINDLMAKN